MESTRRVTRYGVVVLTVLIAQACASAGDGVSGRVIDVDTGTPVAGAYVYARSGYYKCGPFELGGCGCIDTDVALTTTNQSGHYAFERTFDFGPVYKDRFGALVVYKPGYKSIESNARFDTGPGGVPANLIHLYTQYFFGTGRYSDDYRQDPLNSTSQTYKLSSKAIDGYKDTHGVTPRVRYLTTVWGLGGPACVGYQDDETKTRVFKLRHIIQNAIRNEAKRLATTPQDKKILQ